MYDLKKLLNLLYTLTYFVSVVPLRAYDRLHRTEFARIRETGDQDGRYEYYPTSVFSFPFLRRYIDRHLQGGKGHSILDIGCGKGLVLLFFSGMSFDRVSGIECDGKLCALARKNLGQVRSKPQIYQTDAAEFSFYGDYDTFYLYNPFDAAILDRCSDMILRSLQSDPRTLTVIYCNPVYGDLLKAKGFEKETHFYYKTDVFVFHGEREHGEG